MSNSNATQIAAQDRESDASHHGTSSGLIGSLAFIFWLNWCPKCGNAVDGTKHVVTLGLAFLPPQWRTMTEYRLYCFAQSGNAYRAALMLNLIGADWEPICVDFFDKGEQRTAEYRTTVNEMGEVPVLVHGPESSASPA